MLTTLLTSTFVFFILTIHSIFQSNLNWFHIEASKFWSLKILDTDSAATLFVTLVGALLVRHQFAIGVLPRINYVSNTNNKQNGLEIIQESETWQVQIRNTGLGPAIINRVEYFLEISNSKEILKRYEFSSLIRKLTELNLNRDKDYTITNISSGFALTPKDELSVFDIHTAHLPKFKRLTMIVYFQSQLGDNYCREISLLPQD
jgi:hypothetical protein